MWWCVVCPARGKLRDEWPYGQPGGRHASILVGYDATEFNLLPRCSRDASFLRRPDWWPDLQYAAVPQPAILAYRASQMRAATRDYVCVLWEVPVADWVVLKLCEVA